MPTGIYKRKPMSNETKRKIAFAHIGKIVLEETKMESKSANF